MTRSSYFIFVPPLLSISLLCGIVLENRKHVDASTADPYHQAAGIAIGQVPMIIGTWVGQEQNVPPEAVKLLRDPNLLSRHYIDMAADQTSLSRQASLLIVQTRDARDMLGHFPPVCYPANGMTAAGRRQRTLEAGGLAFPLMEYRFTQRVNQHDYVKIVYNVMVVPNVGLVPDMDGIARSAEDYQQRYFGAAQMQVVFDSFASEEPTEAERDEVFRVLVGAAAPAIRTLISGEMQ